MSHIYHDWFNLTTHQVEWLIGLYDWAIFPIPDAYAISVRLLFIEQLSILGLVETSCYEVKDGKQVISRLVRITEHGKQYLEKVHPAELLFKLIKKSQQVNGRLTDSYTQYAADSVTHLVKRLPTEVAPMFLTHNDSEMREIGKRIVDSSN